MRPRHWIVGCVATALVAAAAMAATRSALAGPATVALGRAAAQSACSDVHIDNPKDGETLAGQVAIFGSARIDDFSFYKVETAPYSGSGAWSAVSTIIQAPVLQGLLDLWDTTSVPDGQYIVKLTVVNPIGQEVCSAMVAGLYVGNSATATASPTVTPEVSPTASPTFALDVQPTEEPTAEATIEPIVPQVPDDSSSPALASVETLIAEALGAFVKGFLVAAACAAAVLVVLALRRL